jgi:hypothetical protein
MNGVTPAGVAAAGADEFDPGKEGQIGRFKDVDLEIEFTTRSCAWLLVSV